ncbi:MAG: site-2 protease family protein [Thermoplasmatota archaeon]
MDKRRVYYSFHDMPFEESNQGTSSPSLAIRFSRKEISHILIAIGTLTIAFSFAMAPGGAIRNPGVALSYIPLSFLAIVTAFFCHELAHKYVGQKYGYWSEFRMYPQGLLFALFLGVFLGVVFAAPGAVQIFGSPNREQSGKISAAGPAMNLCIALILFPVSLLGSGLVAQIGFFVAYINAFLALFNLLPFGPLDGAKIFYWRKEIWILLFILGISLLAGLFVYS